MSPWNILLLLLFCFPLTLCTECHVRPDGCAAHDASAATVVIKDSGGRLGNQLFSVVMLISLRLSQGFNAFVTNDTRSIVAPYFVDLGLPVAEEELCGFKETYKQFK